MIHIMIDNSSVKQYLLLIFNNRLIDWNCNITFGTRQYVKINK